MIGLHRFYHTTIILSIIMLDSTIGNGLMVNGLQKLYGKVSGALKNSSQIDEKLVFEPPISLHVFVLEIIVLILTMVFLNNYKNRHNKDRIEKLLQQSRDSLKETNDYLDRWRHKRVPTKFNYFYEKPKSNQLKFEVPVLHMAILDKTTSLNQPERGDASNNINVTDSELLSVTSLIDDDLESIPEATSIPEADKLMSREQKIDYRNRYFNMKKTVI